jgi:hypothetical protein
MWLLALWAAAAAACDPFPADELQQRVELARKSLFYDDMTTFRSVTAEIASRAGCIGHVVAPEVWARHLVSLSIAAYAANEDWQGPLTAALRADPTVDRGVGAAHPISRWSPPEETEEEARPVAENARVYLDGRRVQFLPVLRGPHLVQIERDGVVTSLYLETGNVPEDWLARPPKNPTREPRAGWTTLSGRVGWVAAGQSTTEPGTWIDDRASSAAGMGFSASGAAAIAGRVGVIAEGMVMPTEFPLAARGSLGAGVVGEQLAVGLGVVAPRLVLVVGDEAASGWSAGPAVMASAVRGPFDGAVEAAWSPWLTHGRLGAGWTLSSRGFAPRLALVATHTGTHLTQSDETSARRIDVTRTELSLEVGAMLR